MLMRKQRLRQVNNYNGLGALLAGLNGVAIQRLAQTRALIPPPVVKNVMRLEILMSTAKSYFAYRLAWDNTTMEKIPFLPLHRHDLVAVEESNSTFLGRDGERTINWKKFEMMGDILYSIRMAQARPYQPIQRNPLIQTMMMDGRGAKDEEVSFFPPTEMRDCLGVCDQHKDGLSVLLQ